MSDGSPTCVVCGRVRVGDVAGGVGCPQMLDSSALTVPISQQVLVIRLVLVFLVVLVITFRRQRSRRTALQNTAQAH